MKKVILCISVIGLVAGATVYIMTKKNQTNASQKQSVKNENIGEKQNTCKQEFARVPDTVDDITDDKNSTGYSIHNRHTEAAHIMCNAFENIYKDIEPAESDEKKTDSGTIESAVTNSKLNSFLDELDDLLE